MKHCPNKGTPTGVGTSPDGFVTATHFGCQQWSCPYCAAIRKRMLAHKCYVGIETYKKSGVKNWYFGTITMHENWRGWASIENYRNNWNKFYQRMKRATDGPLYYVVLPEQHAKDGSLHVHIISTCPQSDRWFKDNSRACGMGYMDENGPLENSAKAAMYVTKYIGKSLGILDWPPKFKRVRFSVGWPEPEPQRDMVWSAYRPKQAPREFKLLRVQGYTPINFLTGDAV